MESSSSYQRFAKPTTSTFKTASTSSANCRLRHQLNSDCLIKIFEYLDVQDMIQLCKLDTYFDEIIKSQVIAKTVINLGVLDERMSNNRLVLKRSTIETFELFGKFMRKLIIRGEDFHRFLSTIVKYCKPGRFTYISLSFKINTGYPASNLIDQSVPFFTNLRTLRLSDISRSGLYQLFLTKLTAAATSMTILQLHQVTISEGWLQKINNLRQLNLDTPIGLEFDDLNSCLKANPKLTAFEYKGGIDMKSIYDTLPVCCPELHTFSDRHVWNNISEEDVAQRYEFLSLLKHLDNVTLTSYTDSGHDLDHHLRIPTLKNISKLRVYVNSDRPIALYKGTKHELMESFIEPFDNLKTIEMELRCIGDINCELRCEFIFDLVSRLRNIENIKFSGRSLFNVNSILHRSANIRQLCIADTHFRMGQVAKEMRSILRSVRRIPIRRPSEVKCEKQPLHLRVNEHQCSELELYGDTRGFLTTTVVTENGF